MKFSTLLTPIFWTLISQSDINVEPNTSSWSLNPIDCKSIPNFANQEYCCVFFEFFVPNVKCQETGPYKPGESNSSFAFLNCIQLTDKMHQDHIGNAWIIEKKLHLCTFSTRTKQNNTASITPLIACYFDQKYFWLFI